MLSTSEMVFMIVIRRRKVSLLVGIVAILTGLLYSVHNGYMFYFFSILSSIFMAVVISDIVLFLLRQVKLNKYIVMSLCIPIVIMIGMWLLVDIDVTRMIFIHFKYAMFITIGILGNAWFLIYHKKEIQAEKRVAGKK